MKETDQKIELLKEIARRFNAADITWALWREYYELMGRKEKVDMIESALADR